MAGVLRSYLELCRASNLPTVWTNVLCATLLSSAPWRPVSTLAAAVAVSLFYVGGMALNDVLDVEEDRKRKPQRPIPSGRISRRAAAWFAIALFALGLALLGTFDSIWSMGNGLLLIGLIYLYDRLHSLHPATVLLMAGCRFMVFLTAADVVSWNLQDRVLLGALAQFVYIVLLTVVARWEKHTTRELGFPLIPWMIAGISLVDGVLMAALVHPAWFAAGVAGAVLTRAAQTQVRGD